MKNSSKDFGKRKINEFIFNGPQFRVSLLDAHQGSFHRSPPSSTHPLDTAFIEIDYARRLVSVCLTPRPLSFDFPSLGGGFSDFHFGLTRRIPISRSISVDLVNKFLASSTFLVMVQKTACILVKKADDECSTSDEVDFAFPDAWEELTTIVDTVFTKFAI